MKELTLRVPGSVTLIELLSFGNIIDCTLTPCSDGSFFYKKNELDDKKDNEEFNFDDLFIVKNQAE